MRPRSRAFERYAADGALVLGGAAAILLQLGDPVIARGVAAHSSFATDPMRRLRNTLTYVYAVEIGTAQQARRAAAMVRGSHAGVAGATDPDRQVWVAATLAWTGARTHELLTGPLDPELADEIHAASAALGTALGLRPEMWPIDRPAFDRYWAAAVLRLEVGADARAVAHDLLHPRNVPWWVRAGMPLIRAVTTALLPPPVRAAYSLPTPTRRTRAALAVLRTFVHLTPRTLRELPSRRLLAQI